MSCVVGLLQDGKIYMGADGIATTEDGEKRPIICEKIFTNGKYLIGYTGSVRHGQLIKPREFAPPQSLYDFPEEIRAVFIDKGAILTSDSGQQMQNSNMLIGHKGRLYEILIDFQMNEIAGAFTAIGSGGSYAMGALFATKKWKSPEKRVKNALDAACEYDTSCGLPYMLEVQ